ncbi:hypothetical protein VNI00_011660 [Paramarasmius palmivorus]|uniref:T6SS Phospholipase effector Tle1-like catalytic domain-containing protein n=1 Tax=Paramarasmius palmivorus TaxID=297713 RepID=A0AAW0CE19_9AGAR
MSTVDQPKRQSNSNSIDVEDVADIVRIPSMASKWPGQKYCNCIHDSLSSTPGRPPSRNLVVCIDGTANQFSMKNSNVVELYSRLDKNDALQVTFYNSGIGTYATPSWKSLNYYKQVVGHNIDLAIAWRFEKILLSAYEWICERYEPGDRIFLFGSTSTSAPVHQESTTARPARKKSLGKKNAQSSDEAAALFKRTFCRGNVKVHFVGVWDTVSSVGFARKKELPLTTDGMKHVCFFRHALALDERRVKFLPEFAQGGAGPDTEETEAPRSGMRHTKEVWFAGTHSDIGGGNIENMELKNNGPSLRWMTREAAMTGLLLNPSSTKWSRATKDVNESLTAFWSVLEILPVKRLTYKEKQGTTRRPHFGRRRTIVEGQLIHKSVYWKADDVYKERHNLRDAWDGSDTEKVEPDNFDEVTDQILSSVQLLCYVGKAAERENHLHSLRRLFGTFEARQALMNLSHDLYERRGANKETIAIMDVLMCTASGLFERQHLSRMPRVIGELLKSEREDHNKCAQDFLNKFGTAEIFSIRRKGPVTSFAFSPDSTMIACGTESGNIFVRNMKTGKEVQAPRRAKFDPTETTDHSERVSCIAFSPDAERIISGSWDKTISIWNAKTGERIGVPRDIDGYPRSLVLSDDGSKLVYTVGPETILMPHPLAQPGSGEAGPGSMPPSTVRRHASDVLSVAFTAINNPETNPANGNLAAPYQIVSSSDKSIYLDELNMKHRDQISSVTFSRDGSTIFAGSHDGAIGMWNARTGKLIAMWAASTGDDVSVFATWLGTKRVAVTALALAPEIVGNRIVAGLKDGVVRIWDLPSVESKEDKGEQTKAPTPKPKLSMFGKKAPKEGLSEKDDTAKDESNLTLKRVVDLQHSSSSIVSVAYSPDGKRIAALDEAGLVIVWDATGPSGDCILEQLRENSHWFP